MYVIVGATGHVGSALTHALLDANEPVIAIAHLESKAHALRLRGATVVTADLHNIDTVREILRRGRRAFLLNPPADISTAFAAVLGRAVKTVTIPRERWRATFREWGFSEPAAESYARMTAVSVEARFQIPGPIVAGTIPLETYIADLVDRGPSTTG